MQEEVKQIINEIEELRKNLNRLIDSKGTADPEVISMSRKVDSLLNEYYRLLKEKTD